LEHGAVHRSFEDVNADETAADMKGNKMNTRKMKSPALSSGIRLLFISALVGAGDGCAELEDDTKGGAHLATSNQAIVFGDDNRFEVHEISTKPKSSRKSLPPRR
jgi:hypothetical protein